MKMPNPFRLFELIARAEHASRFFSRKLDQFQFEKKMKSPHIKPYKRERVDITDPTMQKTLALNKDARSLMVDVMGGNLFIEPGPEHEASLDVLWSDNAPLPDFFIENDIVHLRAKSLKPFVEQEHRYAFNLKVPRSFAIDVQMVGGVINLEGLEGPLDLNISVGGVIECQVSSEIVKAHVKAGDVRLFGVRPRLLEASNFFGNVEVCYSEVQEKAEISMRTRLGDVKALFPEPFQPHYRGSFIHNAVGATCRAIATLGDVKIGTYPIDQDESLTTCFRKP